MNADELENVVERYTMMCVRGDICGFYKLNDNLEKGVDYDSDFIILKAFREYSEWFRKTVSVAYKLFGINDDHTIDD